MHYETVKQGLEENRSSKVKRKHSQKQSDVADIPLLGLQKKAQAAERINCELVRESCRIGMCRQPHS